MYGVCEEHRREKRQRRYKLAIRVLGYVTPGLCGRARAGRA